MSIRFLTNVMVACTLALGACAMDDPPSDGNPTSSDEATGDPAANSSQPKPLYGFAPNRMDVFWSAANSALMDTWWNGSAWVVSAL
jgi:hypothetical protein